MVGRQFVPYCLHHVDCKEAVSAGIRAIPIATFSVSVDISGPQADFWPPVSASKNSVPGTAHWAGKTTVVRPEIPDDIRQ